jgi:hypothetical protein
MDKDPDQGQNRRQPSRPGRGGGSNMLGKLLPFLIMFLFKRPKLLIPVLIIGAALYFFGFFDFGGAENNQPDSFEEGAYSLGASLDEEKYDKAEVFEPLASGRNSMPSQTSLLKYAPTVRHQGQQGSCVGWASAYAARSILQSQATGQSADQTAFSPSFLYNHIALRGCDGAYMIESMRFMKDVGALPMREFPYDPSTCRMRASDSEAQRASQFRIRGYQRLTVGANQYGPDVRAIRQHLAQGGPVTIGMMVGGSFMRGMVGRKMWRPSRSDYAMRGFGGHAMCVIGYDDNLEGGAFQIMNSWGPEWGQNGVGWVRYDDFRHFVKEAYGLYPMGRAVEANANRLAVQFGLFNTGTNQQLELQQAEGNLFRTASPVKPGDRFKIAVNNSVECYTYVFGQETDGSSYVLFPYTQKHSAYCGIVGTRLFPKDYSLVPDDLGDTDLMAVVVSKHELDYQALNNSINQASGNYAEKLKRALGSRQVSKVQFSSGKNVQFQAELQENRDAVGVVLAIDKR